MRILVLGANGQLGSDLVRRWLDHRKDVVPATRQDALVEDQGALCDLVARVRPAVVVNTTAWTNLPGCEEDPAKALAVNALGALHASRAAEAVGARLVHISTDYVFDGTKGSPYIETDARNALNVYGASKLAGEDLAFQGASRVTVVRLAALYGVAGASGKGGNFVETMLRLAAGPGPVRVVADQVTSPTNTAEVASALLDLIQSDMEGVVHLAPAGSCSWYDFATAIFDLAGAKSRPEPTSAAGYGGPVRRPAFSALASERVTALPHWHDGLEHYFHARRQAAGAPS
ncbi:MAG: dTDP-4-dehydrorhamnose reductase [Dehalococcoidia bacterium]